MGILDYYSPRLRANRTIKRLVKNRYKKCTNREINKKNNNWCRNKYEDYKFKKNDNFDEELLNKRIKRFMDNELKLKPNEPNEPNDFQKKFEEFKKNNIKEDHAQLLKQFNIKDNPQSDSSIEEEVQHAGKKSRRLRKSRRCKRSRTFRKSKRSRTFRKN
jgi:hypothetical protein